MTEADSVMILSVTALTGTGDQISLIMVVEIHSGVRRTVYTSNLV